MRRTLRSNAPERPQNPPQPRTPHPSESPGASTAASLAWESSEGRLSPDARVRCDSSILPSFLRPQKPKVAPRRPLRNNSPRPASARQDEADIETPPLLHKTLVNNPRGESSPSVPTYAAGCVLHPASPLKTAAASNPVMGSASPRSLGRRILPDAAPAGIARKGREPEVKCSQQHVMEEQLRRSSPRRDPSGRSSQAEPTRRCNTSQNSQTGTSKTRYCGEGPASSVGDESLSTAETLERGSEISPIKRGALERRVLGNLPDGIDETAVRQILGELVPGDKVHWNDIAGLDAAKNSLREAVVYPFLRPDLFIGLRQPACGILLFGPPGTGKTMLARAVATESKSTFFSLSASSLTSKYLGDSEKLVRALFTTARLMSPSIIFIDEIDSLLGQRSGVTDHETTRRIKTEFLIQWSNLQRAVPPSDDLRDSSDANRVLVLAATNLPWAIDEAARRRFVKRQYIPLPEPGTRGAQLRRLLSQQYHTLTEDEIEKLIVLTEGKHAAPLLAFPYGQITNAVLGYSGSDLAALAKDAAMGPLRSLGDALLHMPADEVRPMGLADFEASLASIRPSVSPESLRKHEDWAQKFGEWRK